LSPDQTAMEQLQYPIGRFAPSPDYSAEEVRGMITRLEALPDDFTHLLAGCTDAHLVKTYRPGSWNVRQLVHHVADLHLLYYLRMKKALTEPEAVATMIDMNKWSELPDATQAPVAGSLLMLEGVNERFIYFLQSLSDQDWNVTYYHPVRQIHLSLKQTLFMALWHASHHLAHIELALGRQPRPFVVH
jgi:uncharacterized damage-inducible protein DinB